MTADLIKIAAQLGASGARPCEVYDAAHQHPQWHEQGFRAKVWGAYYHAFYQTSSAFKPSNNEAITALLQIRADARKRRDWLAADQARRALAALGVVVEDGPTGTTWRRQ